MPNLIYKHNYIFTFFWCFISSNKKMERKAKTHAINTFKSTEISEFQFHKFQKIFFARHFGNQQLRNMVYKTEASFVLIVV